MFDVIDKVKELIEYVRKEYAVNKYNAIKIIITEIDKL